MELDISVCVDEQFLQARLDFCFRVRWAVRGLPEVLVERLQRHAADVRHHVAGQLDDGGHESCFDLVGTEDAEEELVAGHSHYSLYTSAVLTHLFNHRQDF